MATISTEQDTDKRHETSNDIGVPKKRRRLSKRQRKTQKKKQQPRKNPQKKTVPDKAEEYRGEKQHQQLESSSLSEQTINVDDSSQKDYNEEHKTQQSEHKHEIQNTDSLVQEEDDDETIRRRCMETYEPTEIPTKASSEVIKQNSKGGKDNDTDAIVDEGGCRTLGKWFPNAILVKSRINYTNTGKLILLNDDKQYSEILSEDVVRVDNPKSSLVLFYQYTTSADSSATVPWDRSQLQLLITYLTKIARRRNLGGRIRVASEGVNATISAVDTQQYSAQETLRHFAKDLQRWDPQVFHNTDFKCFDYLPADRHFKEFKIMPVQELVFYDIGDHEAPLQQQQQQQQQEQGQKQNQNGNDDVTFKGGGGIHLEAKEYHEMLKRGNAVVIDVRNHYETILGRFDGQQQANGSDTITSSGGAEYIDPKMRKSTDFKSWLATPETKEKLQNKTVLMYCTGGIRCERASAYLKSKMGDQVEGVYQLKGGIERYLKTFKDGGFWRGKNFVFDKREAVGIENPEGDGGVIRKQTKKQKNVKQSQVTNDDDNMKLPAKCCVCGQSWDRYVGKKKCSTCGVPVLMCDKCMSLKPDKTPGMELKVRCPLCVEESITILAKEVEFTDNGIKSKTSQRGSSCCTIAPNDSDKVERGKAADSVLKWGGGHAIKKKQLKKMKRRLCQFGNECVRQDCFFYHPDREANLSNIRQKH
jgi:predicted sulfurtransferase